MAWTLLGYCFTIFYLLYYWAFIHIAGIYFHHQFVFIVNQTAGVLKPWLYFAAYSQWNLSILLQCLRSNTVTENFGIVFLASNTFQTYVLLIKSCSTVYLYLLTQTCNKFNPTKTLTEVITPRYFRNQDGNVIRDLNALDFLIISGCTKRPDA